MEQTKKQERGKFIYRLVHPYLEKISSQTDFVDIEVEFEDRKYRGSITTTRFINKRLRDYSKTGENRGGLYFCAKGMIVLRDLHNKTIKSVIEDLIERGDLQEFLNS